MPPAIRVPALRAEDVKRALSRARVLDPAWRPVSRGGRVEFPVKDAALALAAARAVEASAEVVDSEAPAEVPFRDREPRAMALATLAARAWPASALAEVPDKWERYGHVLVLKVPDALRARERELAEAFADALDVDTVLADDAGVAGELREPSMRFLLGEDAVTEHVEHGVRYRFDAAKVMFSSGNKWERARAGTLDAAGETVVDLFAGIGYFALPLAMFAKPRRIVAIEKNPVSHRFLAMNAELNGVAGVVEPWLGDNRDYAPRGFADRVFLGYVGTTREFLPVALSMLKRAGGTLHYHTTCPAHLALTEPFAEVADHAHDAGFRAEILFARTVKSYSPGIAHAVADVRVTPSGDGQGSFKTA